MDARLHRIIIISCEPLDFSCQTTGGYVWHPTSNETPGIVLVGHFFFVSRSFTTLAVFVATFVAVAVVFLLVVAEKCRVSRFPETKLVPV